MDDLTGLKTRAEQSVEDVAKFQENVPGLLSSLRQNLTSIFAKDNPLIQRREQALSRYLSTPSNVYAELLPANLPTVAGSPLTLSPTQQTAIRSAREAAALGPLMSLNQQIVGEYGGLGDILSNAANLYQAQLDAAKTRQTGLFDLYRFALAEQEARRKAAEVGGGGLGIDYDKFIQELRRGEGTAADEAAPAGLDKIVEPDSLETQSSITGFLPPDSPTEQFLRQKQLENVFQNISITGLPRTFFPQNFQF